VASYPGGKNGSGVYQRIICLMPPHQVYIEPFLGGGAVMRHKRPAAVNIGVDLVATAVSAVSAELTPASSAAAVFHFAIGDGIEFLRTYPFIGRELVYCDPPYMLETRSGRRAYRHDMDEVDHSRLMRVLKRLECKVMISGYWSQWYGKVLAEWSHVSYQTMTRGGYQKTEWLWFNFPPPTELHDYRYLGEGYRERERITRKKARWRAKLVKMPKLERQALLAAIADTATLDGEDLAS
jgi:DNA adenine methylase